MAVIGLEALEESPDSNVRFCLAGFRGCLGRKANIRTWDSVRFTRYPDNVHSPVVVDQKLIHVVDVFLVAGSCAAFAACFPVRSGTLGCPIEFIQFPL